MLKLNEFDTFQIVLNLNRFDEKFVNQLAQENYIGFLIQDFIRIEDNFHRGFCMAYYKGNNFQIFTPRMTLKQIKPCQNKLRQKKTRVNLSRPGEQR